MLPQNLLAGAGFEEPTVVSDGSLARRFCAALHQDMRAMCVPPARGSSAHRFAMVRFKVRSGMAHAVCLLSQDERTKRAHQAAWRQRLIQVLRTEWGREEYMHLMCDECLL